MLLHKGKISRALWVNARRQVRIALGIKQRAHPWPPQGLDAVIRHHTELVRKFLAHQPQTWNVRGKTVCETGCSDCLSIASLLIGMGARHVELVEPSEPVLNPGQIQVLRAVREQGFELDTTILRNGTEVTFDPRRVTFQRCFMEDLKEPDKYDYLFSFHVMEHVEDLEGFYAACHRALRPGGQMFHCIDFSGHCELEDPVPPLDFQTYSDWFYNLMYPPFYRATRKLPADHWQAMTRAGLQVEQTVVTRRAEPDYLKQIWPRLCSRAREFPPEEVSILEAVVLSRKP